MLPTSSVGYLNPSENRLRRKTPSGTIDAGYDAEYDSSPMHVFHGPPPPKQFALSASSVLESYGPTASYLPLDQRQPGIDVQPFVPSDRFVPPMAWSTNSSLEPQLNFDASIPLGVLPQMLQNVSDDSRSSFQPVLRANDYNVRAFCPPPMPATGALPLDQLAWPDIQWHMDACVQPALGYGTTQLGDMGAVFDPSFDLTHPTNHAQWSPRQSMGGNSLASNITAGYRAPGARTLGDLSLGVNNSGPQPRFRDKVLAQAHFHYMELLAHLQSCKKRPQMKTGQGSRSVSKLFLYPKPPPTTSNILVPWDEGSATVPIHLNTHHHAEQGTVVTNPFISRSNGYDQLGAAPFRPPAQQLRDIVIPIGNSTIQPDSGLWGVHDLATSMSIGGKLLPAGNAASSLEMLSSLCEQSGWEWIEGMLLGGCFQYALDNYDDALKWFTRVNQLDPR